MRISVIVPLLNEARAIAGTLAALEPLEPDELLLVDGGSDDGTPDLCRRRGIEVVNAPRGRALQMNHGARRATGDALLFLHADTRLPASAFGDMRRALADPEVVGGRFDVRLDGAGLMLALVGRMISWRSRMSKVGTGDQAIFVRRSVFEELGGYPEVPLMEDIAFSRALKRRGRIACLRSRVTTSARRWQTHGVWRTIVTMWTLKSLYLLGVSPVRLKRYYDDAR